MKTTHALFFRRLAAIFYDSLLILAIYLISTLVLVLCNKGNAISPTHPYFPYFQLLLFLLNAFFFIGFWTKGGQTAGMRAWGIKLLSQDASPLLFKQVLKRYVYAVFTLSLFGIGLFWALWDKQHLSLYDRWAKTRLQITP